MFSRKKTTKIVSHAIASSPKKVSRRIKLIDKSFQIRFSVDMAILVIATTMLIGALTYFYDILFSASLIKELVPPDAHPEYFDRLEKHAQFSFLMIFLFTLISGGLLAVIGVFLSHRVVGPLVRFRHAIESLIKGKIPCTITLRKNDVGKAMAAKLNQFFACMKDRAEEDIVAARKVRDFLVVLKADNPGIDIQTTLKTVEELIERKEKSLEH